MLFKNIFLEHIYTESTERPGILVQYNCKKYKCEPDLINKLEKIVLKYNYVYLAPYPHMDIKIALTKYGKLEILDKFDEIEFIEN